MPTLRLFTLLFIMSMFVLGAGFWFIQLDDKTKPATIPTTPMPSPSPSLRPSQLIPTLSPSVTSPSNSVLMEPVKEFKPRITKKSFGTYVTSENSSVQPERFSGYHTGVDVEFGDVAEDVPVHAIADGQVVLSRTAGGYGGVMVIRHSIQGKEILTVYGHLKPSSMVAVNKKVTANQQIAVLGKGETAETDGERKHLHFAMLKKSTVDIAGYVQRKENLADWYNPLDFY